MPANRLQRRHTALLLDRIGRIRYPSPGLLDQLKAGLVDREDAEAYVDVILDAAESQQYPSHRMLARAREMAALIAAVDRLQASMRHHPEPEDSE